MTQIIGAGIQIFDGKAGGGGGAVTAAANGLSVENRAGVQTVVWGGTSLDEDVFIDGQDNNFALLFEGSETAGAIQFSSGSIQLSNGSSSTVAQSNIFTTQNSGDAETGFSVQDIASGNAKSVVMNDTSVQGILVTDDIDNVGLIGDQLFPESDPLQYAQYGRLNTNPANSFAVDLANGDFDIYTENTEPGFYEMFSLNFAVFQDTFSVGAVTQVNLDYIDRLGNPQTVQLVNSVTTGDPISVNYNFITSPNTSLDLSCTSSDTGGGNVITILGGIERLSKSPV